MVRREKFAAQLALFDQNLHVQNEKLSLKLEWLGQELERAEERCMGLAVALGERDAEIEHLERAAKERAAYVKILENEVQILRSLRNLHQSIRATFDAERAPGTADEHLLKKLARIAHPDRWGCGQLASELAHELMITINQVREQGRHTCQEA